MTFAPSCRMVCWPVVQWRDGHVRMDQGEREAILADVFRNARHLRRGNPSSVCLRLIAGHGPRALQEPLDRLDGPWFDYAVASVYSLLLPAERRKRLGAYFTPPHLVAHLIRRMQAAGTDLTKHSFHDPAAGGAAFIVPLVDAVAKTLLEAGMTHRIVLRELSSRLSGVEIDRGLASIANALVRRTLQRGHGITCGENFELISVGDSLRSPGGKVDVVVGNPPYAKVGAARQRLLAPIFPDILGGQLNLYAMFMRSSLDRLTEGGLLGFIVPTSFIGGPEFRQLRVALLARADVLTLDLIEKRTGLFLDVIQDTCFIVLRRRQQVTGFGLTVPTTCSQLSADGAVLHLGGFVPTADGSPWTIPSPTDVGDGGRRLSDYGYRCTVGYLVANRQRERVHSTPKPGCLPLIEAGCIRSDGTFLHGGGKHPWVSASAGGSGVLAQAAVAVQRTSNRKQKRRINAAPIPQKLIRAYGGIVGENHVILIVADGKPSLPSTAMARLLNSRPVNDKYGRMCGTVSLSAKLLTLLDLPDPQLLKALVGCTEAEVDNIVADGYRRSALQSGNVVGVGHDHDDIPNKPCLVPLERQSRSAGGTVGTAARSSVT